MKHVFHPPSKAPDAASPWTARNPADVVRLLAFLTTGTLFLPTLTTATSVVALIDNANQRVVIAADCRVNDQLTSHSECKIIDEPGCTVALAGLYEEKTTAFHLRQLADAASTGKGGSVSPVFLPNQRKSNTARL